MSRKVVVGLVQGKWEADSLVYKESILKEIKEAASQNAQIVFLQELTIHRYTFHLCPYRFFLFPFALHPFFFSSPPSPSPSPSSCFSFLLWPSL
jgi:predicted amidohydrolase